MQPKATEILAIFCLYLALNWQIAHSIFFKSNFQEEETSAAIGSRFHIIQSHILSYHTLVSGGTQGKVSLSLPKALLNTRIRVRSRALAAFRGTFQFFGLIIDF